MDKKLILGLYLLYFILNFDIIVNVEDLNKTQIILLALLVSFVSSVAVSIMTYSLLSEDQLTVTQTINRVVEKTIETVVQSPAKPDVVTKEVTVVVKEEDLIIDAISKNKESLVRIFSEQLEGNIFFSFGTILNSEGLIATPKIALGDGVALSGIMPDGTKVLLSLVSIGDNFSFFKISDLNGLNFKEVLIGDSDALQLGQTLVSIKGENKNEISVGRITSFTNFPVESSVVNNSKYSLIETDVVGLIGSPALNLQGELIGLESGELNGFVPVNLLKSEIGLELSASLDEDRLAESTETEVGQ